MKTHLSLAAFAAFSAALLAGCGSSGVNAATSATPEGKPNPEALSHVITDNDVADAVVPIFYNKGKTDTGFTMAQLQVQNRSGSAARLVYSVEWFDTKGMLCTSTAGKQWKPLSIPAGKEETLQVVSPVPNGVDAKFHFMLATR